MEKIKEEIKQLKKLEAEKIEVSTPIQKPLFDVDDEKVKKAFLKEFLKEGQDGTN